MRLGIKSLMVVMSIVFGALLLSSGAGVGAQESAPAGAYNGDTPEVLSNSDSRDLAPATQVAGTSVERSSGSLAFTGGDATGLVLIGGAAVLVGGALVLARRRTLTAV